MWLTREVVPPANTKQKSIARRPGHSKSKPDPAHIISTALSRFENPTKLPKTLSGFSDPTSSTRELVLRITDYFDSTGDTEYGYQQWLTTQVTDLFTGTTTGSGRQLAKLLAVKAFALPRFSVDTEDSSAMVLFGVPVVSSGKSVCAAQQTTLLTPTSVSKWVKVGSWNASSLYADANVQPITNSEGTVVGGSFAVVNPDTMNLSAVKVQFRVDATFAVTMPPVFQWPVSVPSSNEAPWDNIKDGAVSDSAVVGQYERLQSRV